MTELGNVMVSFCAFRSRNVRGKARARVLEICARAEQLMECAERLMFNKFMAAPFGVGKTSCMHGQKSCAWARPEAWARPQEWAESWAWAEVQAWAGKLGCGQRLGRGQESWVNVK